MYFILCFLRDFPDDERLEPIFCSGNVFKVNKTYFHVYLPVKQMLPVLLKQFFSTLF